MELSGYEENLSGAVVEDHVAVCELPRVYRLGAIPRLRPFRQVGAENKAGFPGTALPICGL